MKTLRQPVTTLHWAAAATLLLGITAVMMAPVVIHPASRVPHDLGDPLLNTWILWWSTRALPFTAAWWNAPMFFPATDVMALSEVLLGVVPFSAAAQALSGDPLVGYNAAFVLSFPLSGLGAYFLALTLTGSRRSALTGALAYTFAVYKLNELAHIQMLMYAGAPLAFGALHRYVDSRQPRWLLVFGGAWLLQALSNGYALFHVSVLVVLWAAWFVRERGVALRIAAALAVAALPLLPLLWRYYTVHEHLHLSRDINQVRRLSADLTAFVAAPPESWLWGGRLLHVEPGTPLFPGITITVMLLLALVAALRLPVRRHALSTRDRKLAAAVAIAAGVVAISAIVIGPWRLGRVVSVTDFHKPFSIAMAASAWLFVRSHWLRERWHERSPIAFYGLVTGLMYLLAMGPEPTAFGHPLLYEPPYAWLMRLPGFSTLRAPARFAMLAVLGQSMCLALVCRGWFGRLTLPRQDAVAAGLCVGVLVDGWGRIPFPEAPSKVAATAGGVDAVLELPLGDAAIDFAAIYRSMYSRLPIVNGYSGYVPPFYVPLTLALADGEWGSVDEVRRYGRLLLALAPGAGTGAADVVRMLDGTTRPAAPWLEGWGTLELDRLPPADPIRFTATPFRAMTATPAPEAVARMHDGDVETAWGSGTGQQGNEEVVIELAAASLVSAVRLDLAAFSFGFPKTLEISVRAGDRPWQTVWQGSTGRATVRAALAAPDQVPLTMTFPAVEADRIRLRQTGQRPDIPWWIAEVAVGSVSPRP